MIEEKDIHLKCVGTLGLADVHYIDYHDDEYDIHLTVCTPKINDYEFGKSEYHYRYQRPNGRIYDCRTLKTLLKKYNQDYPLKGNITVLTSQGTLTINKKHNGRNKE